MQSDYSEKLAYKFTPCKPPESCSDYDDYDPCESSDDITEKDLAVLLKEEKAKLQEAKDKEAVAQVKTGYNEIAETARALNATQREKSFLQEKESSQVMYNKVSDDEDYSVDKRAGSELSKSRTEVSEEKVVKKRVCKKFIKNPFFTNRLKFSSNLPPPPPNPPPQFFPTVEDTSAKGKVICPKRKKKCKKKAVEDKDYEKGRDDEKRKEVKDEEDEGDEYGEDNENKLDSTKQLNVNDGYDATGESEDKSSLYGESQDQGSFPKERTQQELGTGKDRETKRGCKKPLDRPPCRKKVSEISISLQPRQIPALQRDLPPNCPKDIPEVERQILMSCDEECRRRCSEKKCRKKDKTK